MQSQGETGSHTVSHLKSMQCIMGRLLWTFCIFEYNDKTMLQAQIDQKVNLGNNTVAHLPLSIIFDVLV